MTDQPKDPARKDPDEVFDSFELGPVEPLPGRSDDEDPDAGDDEVAIEDDDGEPA